MENADMIKVSLSFEKPKSQNCDNRNDNIVEPERRGGASSLASAQEP